MKKSRIIHPWLFAISPILFLFSHNIHELSIWTKSSLVRLVLPIIIALCGTFLLKKCLNMFFKDSEKTGLMTSLVVITFFSYGIFSDVYSGVVVKYLHREALFEISSFILGPNKLYLFLWALLSVSGAYLLQKLRRDLSVFTRFFNVFASILIIVSFSNILVYGTKRLTIRDNLRSEHATTLSSIDTRTITTFPDIYYIILDAYASASTLQELYEYDNQEFLDNLRQKGFYIASQSCSNYAFTTLSLPSSLNMEYMNFLGDRIGKKSKDLTVPIQFLRDNKVIHFLHSLGYAYIHFVAPFTGTDHNPYADVEIDCDQGFIHDRFLKMLIQTSFLASLVRFFPQKENFESIAKRQRIQCKFSRLVQLGDEFEEPIFVFAHIVAPHFPYVFGPNGEFVSEEERKTADSKTLYINQLIFINKKVNALVEHLLANSENNPPIIILQADHGPWNVGSWEGDDLYKNRMKILNAYYLSDGGNALLYDSVTPVNTFRIIFNRYFGTTYDLLEDHCYYSWYEHPYKFINVTERIR
jgi:hypothetical protein